VRHFRKFFIRIKKYLIKKSYLSQIQKRLPDDIIIQDETIFEFTEDEYVGILSWIKYFNEHYIQYKKEKLPSVKIPIISKRIRLDFGLYNIPCDIEDNKGKFIIYISSNIRFTNEKIIKNPIVKDLINTWNLY